MFVRFFLTLLLIMLTACASNQPLNAPDWYLNNPSDPDTVYGNGVDEKSEIYAVASALSSIGFAEQAKISGFDRRTSGDLDERYESVTESIVDFKVGDISVQGMMTTSRDSTKAGDLTAFKHLYKIISSNFLIRSVYEKINDKITADERSSSTVNINDLINELEKNGASVKLENRNNVYFSLVGIPRSVIQ